MLVQILKNYVIIKINNLSVLPNAAVTSGTPTDSGITNGHSSNTLSHSLLYTHVSILLILLTGFLEVPMSIIVALGEPATFYCDHSATQDIAWRVNDTSLSVLRLSTVKTRTIRRIQTNDSVGDGFVHELAIEAHIEYNQTLVRCLAYVDGTPVEYSPNVTMLVQGKVLLGISTLGLLPCALGV